MKLFQTRWAAAVCALFTCVSSSFGLVIDTDTIIASNDTNYESLDLVVTNCTLTVDGPHTFGNLQLLCGAVLTHSSSGGPVFTNIVTVLNELHSLSVSETNPATLDYSHVLTNTIVLADMLGDTNYIMGVDFYVSFTSTTAQLLLLPGSKISEGDLMSVSYQSGELVNVGLFLTVLNNFEIEAGGKLDLAGRGYGPGLGSGAGKLTAGVGSGGGHGGYGGAGSGSQGGSAYGGAPQPTTLGSGGSSSGGSGGGLAQISVGNLTRIDGIVSVNGTKATNSQMGGGAGGSVWLTTSTLTGAGSVSANGGSGELYLGGGGAGGHIAIYADTNLFTGDVVARGGAGWNYGGAGTIYLKGDGSSVAQVIVDNRGGAGTNTSLLSLTGSYDLTIQGKAIVVGTVFTVRNLTVRSNSWLMPVGSTQSLSLTVTGDALIETNGGLMFDLKGYAGGTGTGTPSFNSLGQGGAGHGGMGGAGWGGYFGASSGSVNAPISAGSGGGGGSTVGGMGGGAVSLTVSGTLSLFGKITANGGDALASTGGGGAGGSILLDVGLLTGNGRITADGGNGDLPAGGGGGGGRIAINYKTNIFTGRISAFGGYGFMFGGAGTIYSKGTTNVLLLTDNGGAYGSYTPIGGQPQNYDLVVLGGAAATNIAGLTLNSLYVGSNSYYVPGTGLLVVSQNATVEGSGIIDADGDGSATSGTGFGRTSSSIGSGGGYGGTGGSAISPSTGTILGGNAYGSITAPIDLGSAGGLGSGSTSYNYGGAGGGIVRMTVNGTLTINGTITANGLTGQGGSSGGGSGGSINLTAGRILGTGVISANGGVGESLQGGGGGGGRIAINSVSNFFAGITMARGGAGKSYGGAGTIYRKSDALPYGELVLDNGGNAGGATPFTLIDCSMTVSGGAFYTNGSTSSSTLRSLVIGSNSVFQTAAGASTLTVATNMTIAAGGKFSAEGMSTSQTGSGGNLSSTGGGGAFGGNGGASSAGAAGGLAFTATSGSMGGPGGWSTTTGTGGLGGGGVTLTVTGNLQVDGKLSANGNSAIVSGAGGGAGGALTLSLGRLMGSGVISANGGAGEPPAGGGGGGGRINITYNTNTFTGQITAFGGAGANYGGAGPVSLKRNQSVTTQWIVDNGGFSGALTPFAPSGDTLIKGGAIVTNNSSGATCNNLYIATNSWLIPNSASGSTGYLLSISTNLVIEEGAGITADGSGGINGGGTSPGQSINSVGGGGGHGGVGGASITGALGGSSYDSITLPTGLGSSGGSGSNSPLGTIYGGAGGGYINLNVGAALTNNGKITANGLLGKGTGSGGGAGGSILLSVGGNFTGKGSISANGGAGENAQAGGGGGGRIAITYGSNNVTGPITAYGGAGWLNGGAGTIYLKTKTGSSSQLVVDNGGLSGGTTPVTTSFDSQAAITVANGSTLSINSSTQTYSGLLIKSNGVVTSAVTNSATVSFIINGDVTIESGGRLHADAIGYNSVGANGGGSYSGSSTPWGPTGGGGGHGGYGGMSAAGVAGGLSLDSTTAPVTYGGAGGATPFGPSGGGAIRLSITGNLKVDGALTANGQSGSTSSGNGGGAGGSVYVTMSQGTLRGSGVIQANGGAGDLPGGGGGGGGRIALYFKTNLFAGDFSAFGGAGANYGGAGTIYLSTNQQSNVLILDNNGNRGAVTPIAASSRVSILDGAIGSVASSSTFDSLLIGSNAWLTYSNLFPTITVTKNTIIEKGGGVLLAGKGSPSGSGLGTSSSSGSGGGGHGGYGGNGASGAGGANHDSILGPVNNGGPGGTTTGTPTVGGGAFRFTTTQTLTLDGDILVNGANATNSTAGGGAGGSVWINAGTFTGGGSIQANGGTGKSPTGGGGAGGMIALYYNTSTFSGSLSAHGAGGINAGGAGTIYSRKNSDAVGTVMVDNAGITGTNTPIVLSQSVNLLVSGRANVTLTGRQTFTSLNIAPDGAIVHSSTTTNLDLLVLQDALVNGVITADRSGLMTNGPGSGQYGFAGSGGGYGGNGGDSSSSTGGTNYGSQEFPTDRGSGGGALASAPSSRTFGGGAVRLQVGGALTVNGSISSAGGDGLLSNAGGGSGGSIWVSANSFRGTGSVSANGGNGEPSEAGGGGGGRIAVHAHTNVFTGLYSVSGGQGWMNGADGTVFLGTNFSGPTVVSISVAGTVTTAFSSLDIQFDAVLDSTTSFPSDFPIDTPNGEIQPTTISFIGLSTIRLGFPVQTAIGNYVVHVGPYIYDMFHAPMSAPYTSSFTIAPLFISGTVMDTNNVPLSGIELQATGLSSVTSDTNGAYTVAVNPTWTGTITPDTNYMFLPESRSYMNVVANVTNQNYVVVTPDVMQLTSFSSSNSLTVGIFGVSQVKYQAYSSSNLVDWVPYGSVITGGNSNIALTLPMVSSNQFFQFRVSN